MRDRSFAPSMVEKIVAGIVMSAEFSMYGRMPAQVSATQKPLQAVA